MFKNIIVGIDFSPSSIEAARQANDLSKKTKARVTLVHVVDKSKIGDAPLAQVKNFLAAKIKKKFLGTNKSSASVEILVGSPAGEIAGLALKMKDPLIIVGATKKGVVSRFYPGSTALALASNAKVPVLVHKKLMAKKRPEVLVPFDLTTHSEGLLQDGERIAKVLGAKCTGVYILEPTAALLDYEGWYHYQQARLAQKRIEFGEIQNQFKKVEMKFERGQAAEEVARLSRKSNLVVIQSHNRGGWLEVLGSVTDKVVKTALCSVLVLPKG